MAALNTNMSNSNSNSNSNRRRNGFGLYNRTKQLLGKTKGKINDLIGARLDVQTIQMIMVLFVFIMVAFMTLGYFNPLKIGASTIRYLNVVCFLLLSLFLAMIYLSLNPQLTGGSFNSATARTYLSRFLGLFISGFGFTLLAMLPMLLALSGSNFLSGTLLFIVTCILIITTTLVVYAFFSAYLAKQNDMSYAGLLKNTILYIPCLLIDAMEFIRKQYNLTTKPILILLIFDIIFILAYFNLTHVEKVFKIKNETTLLKNPIYLNKKRVVGNYEDLKNTNAKTKTKEDESYTMEIEKDL